MKKQQKKGSCMENFSLNITASRQVIVCVIVVILVLSGHWSGHWPL